MPEAKNETDKPCSLLAPSFAPKEWNIYQRINWVRSQIGYVKKTKVVVGHGYKAVTHDEVTAMIRPHLIKAGVATVQTLTSSTFTDTGQQTKNGVPIHLYTGGYNLSLVNVDNPEDVVTSYVEAQALDVGDKASGKSMSYAKKYFYLKTFDIETGEDEESRIEAKAKEAKQISPDPVNMDDVRLKAKAAMALIDDDAEDYSEGEALAILDSLSNDERIALQAVLKAAMVPNTRKTYFGAFKEHMKLERAAMSTQDGETSNEQH